MIPLQREIGSIEDGEMSEPSAFISLSSRLSSIREIAFGLVEIG
jgi:hypothetical protein